MLTPRMAEKKRKRQSPSTDADTNWRGVMLPPAKKRRKRRATMIPPQKKRKNANAHNESDSMVQAHTCQASQWANKGPRQILPRAERVTRTRLAMRTILQAIVAKKRR